MSEATPLDPLLERIGYGRGHRSALLLLGFASACQSVQTNVLGFLMPCAAVTFDVGLQGSALIGALNLAASCVAAPLIGLLADHYGRRPAILFTLALIVAAGVGSAAAPTFWVLCVSQTAMGAALGGYMPPLCLATEMAPPSSRGRIVNLSNWFWSAGTVLVVLAGWAAVPFAGWRLQLAAIVAPTFAVLPWAWSRLRESPLWLLEHGQPDAAADVLQRLASDNGRPLDAAELKQLRELAAPPKPAAPAPASATAAGAKAAPGSGVAELALAEGYGYILRSPRLRSIALIHWSMWLLTGFLYQALIFYSTIAFEESADDEEASLEAGCAFDYAAELLIAVAEIPGVLLAHALIDRPCGPGGLLGGRRGTQWLPYALCAAATYGMSLRAAVGPTGVLVCGALARFCLSAASSAQYVAAPELYPTAVRSTGANTAFFFTLVGGVPAGAFVYSDLPQYAVALGVALSSALSAALILMLPETAASKAAADKGAEYGTFAEARRDEPGSKTT